VRDGFNETPEGIELIAQIRQNLCLPYAVPLLEMRVASSAS
jgi:hypothetical protein